MRKRVGSVIIKICCLVSPRFWSLGIQRYGLSGWRRRQNVAVVGGEDLSGVLFTRTYMAINRMRQFMGALQYRKARQLGSWMHVRASN